MPPGSLSGPSSSDWAFFSGRLLCVASETHQAPPGCLVLTERQEPRRSHAMSIPLRALCLAPLGSGSCWSTGRSLLEGQPTGPHAWGRGISQREAMRNKQKATDVHPRVPSLPPVQGPPPGPHFLSQDARLLERHPPQHRFPSGPCLGRKPRTLPGWLGHPSAGFLTLSLLSPPRASIPGFSTPSP